MLQILEEIGEEDEEEEEEVEGFYGLNLKL